MKNVLPSKKFRNCNEKKCAKCMNPGLHFPKTTLVSNWKRRNDSSNVNSALQHEYGKHSCYPEQTGTKPMLSCKPKTCVSKKINPDQKLQSTSSTCLCEESTSNDNTTFDTDDEFDYTKQRKAYHRHKGDDEKPASIVTDTSDDKDLHESVATIYGTNKATTSQTPATSSYFTSQASVEDLKAFRNEHNLDAHNVEKYAEEVPEHTCTFQFKLDDFLALQPLNTDSYGKSRCKICNVTMKQKQFEQHNPYYDTHPSAMKMRKAALRDKLELAQRTIGITGEKAKIELKCTSADDDLKNVFKKYQKPQYFNTFALRQQKMIF
ncbi:unnamed protein product [Callosobruchus maculatus]|uniref:Uncharacterized protein n=1 Tax=Callosobruchus maculatus TaxID=64391 RepID=A0A653DMC2_CALMS|nr:unnamed protein product [Callosobruchus maculatus]